MARLVKAMRTMQQVFPPVSFRPYCAPICGEVDSSAAADLGNNVVSATNFATKAVTMETYYKGWIKFISICITGGVFSTTVNQYMTNKQINGMESKIEGLESKIEGTNQHIDGLESKIEGTNQHIDGLECKIQGLDFKIEGISRIQMTHETVLIDIRREIQGLKLDSNVKFAELKAVLEKPKD